MAITFGDLSGKVAFISTLHHNKLQDSIELTIFSGGAGSGMGRATALVGFFSICSRISRRIESFGFNDSSLHKPR
jgi:hypothetical protein